MDSSSDDESVVIRRKSSSKRVIDSDDEPEDTVEEKITEATEDFKLHLSDVASSNDKIESTLIEHNENSISMCKDLNVTEIATISKETSDPSGVKETHDIMKKLSALADSDSESDVDENHIISGSEDLKETNSPPHETEVSTKPKKTLVIQETGDIMKRLSALADSDSESDIDGDLEPLHKSGNKSKIFTKRTLDSDSDSHSASKVTKGKAGSERKSKTNAKNAMSEIKAESQRRLRQSDVGLPYHVPKQRTLLDFLNRRKPSSSMPIKSSADQLASVWKHIEEREKEVEEFYKSESEQESDSSDDECHNETTQATEEIPKAPEENGRGSGKIDIDEVSAEEAIIDSEENTPKPESLPTGSSSVAPQLEQVSQGELKRDESSSTSSTPTDKNCSPLKLIPDELQSNSEIADMTRVCTTGPGSEKGVIHNSTHVLPASSKSSTQESQDISLHFSETQDLLKNNCVNSDDVSQNQVHDDQDIEKVGSPIKKSEIQQLDKVNAPSDTIDQSRKWEELNAAMNCLDENNSDCEDAKETSPKKLSVTSAFRLSLKGAPNGVIDLNDFDSSFDHSRTPGVKGLIERFVKHSATKVKPPQAQTVELSVTSSEKDTSGDVVNVKQESLKIVLTADTSGRSDNVIPGARLKLLKHELNRQMRKQKEEEWQKKYEEMKNEQVFKGEKDDCGFLPDEEEEEDMTESETESEPEINDVREPKRKSRLKKMFADEEAEVEDDNEDADEKEEEIDEDEEVESKELGVGSDAYDDDSDSCDETENVDASDSEDSNKQVKSTLKSNFKSENISSPAEQNSTEENDNCLVKPGRLQRTMTSVSDLFASQSNEWEDDDDDLIPAAQPNGASYDKSLSQSKDEGKERTMLFSPMSLSIPGRRESFMDADGELTPTKMSWTMGSKSQGGIKQLFSETQPSSTQEKLDELAGLFAEKFNESPGGLSSLANTTSNTESESDLMALCSGKFVTQPPRPEELEGDCAQASGVSQFQFSSQTPVTTEPSQVSTLSVEDSVDFRLTWDEDTQKSEDKNENSSKATGKFQLEIMSSDEDDNITETREKKRKKNRKLEFSDDEDDDGAKANAAESDVELSDLDSDEDKTEDPKLFGVFNKPSKEVFYDSDENEIEANEFFDKEAELSEEENWQGSDDEDENGLDQLEMNEADKDDIDQDLVREQLVKSHMQKMLDEDRRDVRILQEMLLEDGELHSDTGGRERQFRWKNVDSTGMADDNRHSDEEHADHDEDEDDADWRKERHQREMFLKETREKQKNEAGDLENDEVIENSELLQLGKSVLIKCRSSSQELSSNKEPNLPTLSVNSQLVSPDGKRPSMLYSKRGSFLSRGDNILAKLAKLTGPAKENVLAGAKSKGNFVFSAMNPTEKRCHSEEDVDAKSTKRKASVGLANYVGKKPCLSAPLRKGSGLFDHL